MKTVRLFVGNVLITLGVLALGYAIGLVEGLQHAKLKRALKALIERPPAPLPPPERVGGTQGSYKKVENITPSMHVTVSKVSGVVKPKTPQQLEFESNAKLQKAAEDWRVDIKQ
jgi:hypothetical protein